MAVGYEKWESVANFYNDHGLPTETGLYPNVYRSYATTRGGKGPTLDGWDTKPEPCWSYNDPRADVMADLNLLMFKYVLTSER